jgi:acyl-CoA thioesterase
MAFENLTERSPFSKSLGVQIEEFNNGYCLCTLEIKDHLLNTHKAVHGGVIYSLADIGMGAALYSTLDDERCSTIEIKINYLNPAYTDNLLCEARIIQKGKSIAVLEAEVKSDEKLIAKATGTFTIFKSNK